MISMTPAQERYTRFSCPNPPCPCFNRPGAGNIVHRSWTGKHKHIERLRCTACDREFSAREGTLMARSKLPEATVIQLLKCQRWGVCDEGTADICAVDLKTVHRFQAVATHRAQTPQLQVVGVVYRPRRRGNVGRKPKPRLVAPKNVCYAQVVKVRDKAGHVVEVSRRVVFGGPRRFGKQWRLRQLGETIQTAFMERWYGTLRGLVAPLRRRTRCLSWSHARHRGKVWLMVSLYNFVMPHKSLRQGRTSRTPAMALGLTDHVWSYGEYSWLPVHTDPVLSKQMDERVTCLLTPALQGQSLEKTQVPTHAETLEEHEKEAAPLPKAA